MSVGLAVIKLKAAKWFYAVVIFGHAPGGVFCRVLLCPHDACFKQNTAAKTHY